MVAFGLCWQALLKQVQARTRHISPSAVQMCSKDSWLAIQSLAAHKLLLSCTAPWSSLAAVRRSELFKINTEIKHVDWILLRLSSLSLRNTICCSQPLLPRGEDYVSNMAAGGCVTSPESALQKEFTLVAIHYCIQSTELINWWSLKQRSLIFS